MNLSRDENLDEGLTERFASYLEKYSSRYEEEAQELLRAGLLRKNFDGISCVHFLRGGGSGYRITSEPAESQEDDFFQVLDEDPEYRLKLLIDQLAQCEVEVSFITNP